MRVGIFLLTVVLIIAGLAYMASKIDVPITKVEVKGPKVIKVIDEPTAYVTPEGYYLFYPLYYSFEDMVFKVDKPDEDNVSEVTRIK